MQLHISPEQRMAILRVLGQVHIADDVAEGDIKGKEQFKVCCYPIYMYVHIPYRTKA